LDRTNGGELGSGVDIAALRAGGGARPAVCTNQWNAGWRDGRPADLHDHSRPPLSRTVGIARQPFQSPGASTSRTTGRPSITSCFTSARRPVGVPARRFAHARCSPPANRVAAAASSHTLYQSSTSLLGPSTSYRSPSQPVASVAASLSLPSNCWNSSRVSYSPRLSCHCTVSPL